MNKNKFVFENFSDFLMSLEPLTEEEKDPGTELDPQGAEELVDKIIKLNIRLARNYFKETGFFAKLFGDDDNSPDEKSARGIFIPKLLDSLDDGEFEKSVLYMIMAGFSTAPDNLKNRSSIGFNGTTKSNSGKEIPIKGEALEKKLREFGEKIDEMPNAEAEKLSKIGLENYQGKIPSQFQTPLLWEFIDQAGKQKVYDDFYELAIKRGYNTKEGLEKVIENEFDEQIKLKIAYMQSPAVRVKFKKEELVETTPPLKIERKTYILDEDKESEVFKQNKFGANGAEDFQEKSFEQMRDNLGSIFQRLLAGEITRLVKISILTSADRYMNTGDAESLSWGQLSYLRATTMASMIESMAREVGLGEQIISNLPNIISLYTQGENGDGSSGPNAPEPKKFGYYVKSGEKVSWVAGKNRSEVIIIPIEEDGTPLKDSAEGITPKNEPPESDISKYNKFRYNNIEIEFEFIDGGSKETFPTSEKIINLKYPVEIKIPSRFKRKSIKIPLPVIVKSGSGASGGEKNKPGKCPTFNNDRTKVRRGLTMKKVEIYGYDQDITKK